MNTFRMKNIFSNLSCGDNGFVVQFLKLILLMSGPSRTKCQLDNEASHDSTWNFEGSMKLSWCKKM